jgi:hypothetical protein
VHEANRALQFDGSLQRAVFAQRADIVDHCRPCGNRGAHDGGLAGVDGYGHADGTDDGFDDRQNPVEFCLLGYIGRARPRRLAADIDNGGAVTRHGLGLAERGVTADESSAVRERIGRDVQNPHHGGDIELQRTERQHGFIVRGSGSRTEIVGNLEGSRFEKRSY